MPGVDLDESVDRKRCDRRIDAVDREPGFRGELRGRQPRV